MHRIAPRRPPGGRTREAGADPTGIHSHALRCPPRSGGPRRAGQRLAALPRRSASAMRDWITDPAEITRRSFAIVAAEADLARFDATDRAVATRVIDACGMVEM